MEKNCCNCKYDDLGEYDFPCSKCKFTYNPVHDSDNYEKDPLLWEAADNCNVNHPQHYNHGKFECIDVMVENFGKEAVEHFCLLNAFKYVWRSHYKNGTEDIKKAMWYLDKYLELEGEHNAESN